MSTSNAFKIFDTVVVPAICYGSEVWGYEYSETIERVQLKFCRYLLGVNSSVSRHAILGECGRLPLCCIYFKRCISYWIKLLGMENNRYPKACYNMLKSLDDAGRNTWASHIKKLLFRYGFGTVWIEQQVGNPTYFLNLFSQRIRDCYQQEWHYEITTSSQLSLYCQFKSLLEPEKYLNNLNYNCKCTLANFRCSSHKLNNVIGRHLKLPLRQRICIYCKNVRNIEVVENEFHFVLICPLYEDIREEYIPTFFRTYPSNDKLLTMLSSRNMNTIYQLSKYLCKAFKRREEIVPDLFGNIQPLL